MRMKEEKRKEKKRKNVKMNESAQIRTHTPIKCITYSKIARTHKKQKDRGVERGGGIVDMRARTNE